MQQSMMLRSGYAILIATVGCIYVKSTERLMIVALFKNLPSNRKAKLELFIYVVLFLIVAPAALLGLAKFVALFTARLPKNIGRSIEPTRRASDRSVVVDRKPPNPLS